MSFVSVWLRGQKSEMIENKEMTKNGRITNVSSFSNVYFIMRIEK